MPNYRRNRVSGGAFFFTVNLLDRTSDLLVAQIAALRLAVGKARMKAPFHIDAWVVLPDHMHCIWTLPDADADFPSRWKAIKTAFSKSMPASEGPMRAKLRNGERGIWQRRYWEHTIRDDLDYANHMDYTHFNPVKHGLVNYPADWAFSSFRRCVANWVYPADWAGEEREVAGAERKAAEGATLFRPTSDRDM